MELDGALGVGREPSTEAQLRTALLGEDDATAAGHERGSESVQGVRKGERRREEKRRGQGLTVVTVIRRGTASGGREVSGKFDGLAAWF